MYGITPKFDLAKETDEQLIAILKSPNVYRRDTARRLLQEIPANTGRDELWLAISGFLIPGSELKAEYAFADLWEDAHGGT